MLQKGVYPFEYVYSWQKLSGTLLSGKNDLYSNLNMEDIMDADYKDARFCEDFEIKSLDEYHYLLTLTFKN